MANHTTVLDVVLLQQYDCYAIVGQKHPGIIGFFEHSILEGLGALWFDRFAITDRQIVSSQIKKHIRVSITYDYIIYRTRRTIPCCCSLRELVSIMSTASSSRRVPLTSVPTSYQLPLNTTRYDYVFLVVM